MMTDLSFADSFGEGRTESPYWNESVWFSLSVPERRIHGMIQYYFRPNMGMLNGGPCLWDPSGTFQWNCLYYNWSHLQAMPEGAAKFDMHARNSLRVKMIEPLQRYKIDYDKEGFELDLTWEAIAPVHELRTGDPGAAVDRQVPHRAARADDWHHPPPRRDVSGQLLLHARHILWCARVRKPGARRLLLGYRAR
jgi:hypothetical protein